MTAMDELGEAKAQLRAVLPKGQLAGGRADVLIDRYQRALKQAYRERLQLPARGDQVEQWLKAHRDRREERDGVWWYLDEMLDDYRLHADTRTPLDQHVCENGAVDDCVGCYEVSKGTRQ